MDLYKTNKKKKVKYEEPKKIITGRENMIVGSIIAIGGGVAVGWFAYDMLVSGNSNNIAFFIQAAIGIILIGFGLYKLIYALTSKRYSKEAAEEERKKLEEETKKARKYYR